MNANAPLNAANVAAMFRQGYYSCDHCNRLSFIGRYYEPEATPTCPHCHKRTLRWNFPVLPEGEHTNN